eukprot:1489351-Amphidinium_carterae.1
MEMSSQITNVRERPVGTPARLALQWPCQCRQEVWAVTPRCICTAPFHSLPDKFPHAISVSKTVSQKSENVSLRVLLGAERLDRFCSDVWPVRW